MSNDNWWEHRNNRRNCRLPDLNAPFDPDTELPGTPASRFAACMQHIRQRLIIADIHAAQRRAWAAAQMED